MLMLNVTVSDTNEGNPVQYIMMDTDYKTIEGLVLTIIRQNLDYYYKRIDMVLVEDTTTVQLFGLDIGLLDKEPDMQKMVELFTTACEIASNPNSTRNDFARYLDMKYYNNCFTLHGMRLNTKFGEVSFGSRSENECSVGSTIKSKDRINPKSPDKARELIDTHTSAHTACLPLGGSVGLLIITADSEDYVMGIRDLDRFRFEGVPDMLVRIAPATHYTFSLRMFDNETYLNSTVKITSPMSKQREVILDLQFVIDQMVALLGCRENAMDLRLIDDVQHCIENNTHLTVESVALHM